jgi:hypothetical protein
LVFLLVQILQVSGHGELLCSVSAGAHAGQLTDGSLKFER